MWHCFTCDYTNDTDVEDCWSCGTSRFSQFGDARLWDTIPSQVSSEQEEPVFEETPVFEEVPVREDIPHAEDAPEATSGYQWPCFTCHYINQIEAEACWNCGTARISQFGDAALWNAPPSKVGTEVQRFEDGVGQTRYSSEILRNQSQRRKAIQKEEEDEPLLTIYTGSISIGQILGLQLYCNFSLLLWLPCIWFELIPHPISIGILLSTFVHEFAHVVVSRWLGLKNGLMILWGFGGYFVPLDFERTLAQMNRQERYEYTLMTAAGPLSNLLLALIAGLAGYMFSLEQVIWFAALNLCLCVFYSLPIPSSDGEKLMTALSLSYGFPRQKIYKWLSIFLFCLPIFFLIIDFKFINDSLYAFYWRYFLIFTAIHLFKLRNKSDEQLEKEHQKEIQNAQEFILRKTS